MYKKYWNSAFTLSFWSLECRLMIAIFLYSVTIQHNKMWKCISLNSLKLHNELYVQYLVLTKEGKCFSSVGDSISKYKTVSAFKDISDQTANGTIKHFLLTGVWTKHLPVREQKWIKNPQEKLRQWICEAHRTQRRANHCNATGAVPEWSWISVPSVVKTCRSVGLIGNSWEASELQCLAPQ